MSALVIIAWCMGASLVTGISYLLGIIGIFQNLPEVTRIVSEFLASFFGK